jgi:DNA-binding MarR family transcriptional regulator
MNKPNENQIAAAEQAGMTRAEFLVLCEIRNYDRREAQKDDNYSNCDFADAARVTGFNRHGVAALVGSLEKKGLAWVDEDEYGDTIWFTDDGIDAVYNIMEAK